LSEKCENCRFFRGLNPKRKALAGKYGICIHPAMSMRAKPSLVIFEPMFPDQPYLVVRKDFSCRLFEEKPDNSEGSPGV